MCIRDIWSHYYAHWTIRIKNTGSLAKIIINLDIPCSRKFHHVAVPLRDAQVVEIKIID